LYSDFPSSFWRTSGELCLVAENKASDSCASLDTRVGEISQCHGGVGVQVACALGNEGHTVRRDGGQREQ